MADEKKTLEPRWLWYFIGFIIPVVGIILGIMYRRKEAPESQAFGKSELVAGILGVVACVVLYVAWFFVLGAAGALK